MDWKSINETYVHPARALYDKGQKREAFDLLEKGFMSQNQDGYIALTLADLYENELDDANARKYFEIALRRLPLQKWKTRAREGLERIRNRTSPPKENKTIIIHGDVNIGGKAEIKDSVLNRTDVMGTKTPDGKKKEYCPDCGKPIDPANGHCQSCDSVKEE
jgi:tetratricopeptide (TPR) repeat protein